MEIIFCLTQEWILSKRCNRAKNLQILQFAQGKLALIHGKWWCKLRVFKGSFRFVHLYHHSFAHDNRGQQFASCNFSRRSTQDFPQPNQLLSHRFGHRGSPNSTDTRTYLCHLFHADVLSASFVDEMWILDEICSVFFGISNLNIGIHRFCLYIDAVYRGGIASEVRPHDYKEESFH